MLHELRESAPRGRIARQVREGLSREGQKTLPCELLYDDLGSALFEAICRLDEYGLSRAGERLIDRARDELADALAGARVVELGSGAGGKTRRLLEAFAERAPVSYHPIDVSQAALDACRGQLAELGRVSVEPFCGTYLEGLDRAGRTRSASEDPMLVLFLGSTIGNFEPAAAARFLADVRKRMSAEDALLIAFDLVKPEPVLLEAYDDPLGVTAAFDLNILARINRELGANFALGRFQHEARWDSGRNRIEMHLRSTCDQLVHIPAAEISVRFRAGETIWTESSHKFRRSDLPGLAAAAGFEEQACWVDESWPFAQGLWRAV